jgi:hypothetical protein
MWAFAASLIVHVEMPSSMHPRRLSATCWCALARKLPHTAAHWHGQGRAIEQQTTTELESTGEHCWPSDYTVHSTLLSNPSVEQRGVSGATWRAIVVNAFQGCVPCSCRPTVGHSVPREQQRRSLSSGDGEAGSFARLPEMVGGNSDALAVYTTQYSDNQQPRQTMYT